MAPDETLHLAESLRPRLPYNVPILPLPEHLVVDIEHRDIDLGRPLRSSKHEQDLRFLFTQKPCPREEARQRLGLGRPALENGHADGVPVDGALALGEEAHGGVEGEEDAEGKGGEEASGGRGGCVLVLDHEGEAEEERGQAGWQHGRAPRGDKDVRAEAAEVQCRGEDPAREAARRDGRERVGCRCGCGGFEGRGGRAEDEGAGGRQRGVELVGERDGGVDTAARASAAAREGEAQGIFGVGVGVGVGGDVARGWGGVTGVGEVAAEARAGGHRGACAEGEVWGSGVAEAEEADGGASGRGALAGGGRHFCSLYLAPTLFFKSLE